MSNGRYIVKYRRLWHEYSDTNEYLNFTAETPEKFLLSDITNGFWIDSEGNINPGMDDFCEYVLPHNITSIKVNTTRRVEG